jgi:hypothetical protein
MMNSGAPITGSDKRPLNKAGMDIRNDPSVYSGEQGTALGMPDIIPTRQSFQCQVLRFSAGAE